MTNNEAHNELSDVLSKYVRAKDKAITSKDAAKYDKPIEALRYACKILRTNADQINTNQIDLF